MSAERETRDFMSVDAFSQLPFIRPSPVKPDKICGNAAIRLFGIDFTHDPPADPDSSSSSSSKDNNKDTNSCTNKDNNNSASQTLSADTNRKFECHYCCRNFPTSQALGGHQNAHKRERQNAKRAHLQSAMAAAHHQSLAEGAHVYGLVNYHRLGSIPASERFGLGLGLGHAFDPLPVAYPSWSPADAANFPSPRFYAAGSGSPSQPIGSGGPLPGLWRVPPAPPTPSPMQREAAMPLPLFAGDEDPRLLFGGGTAGPAAALSNSTSSPPPPPPHPHESIGMYGAAAAANGGAKDQHLSLDLHL